MFWHLRREGILLRRRLAKSLPGKLTRALRNDVRETLGAPVPMPEERALATHERDKRPAKAIARHRIETGKLQAKIGLDWGEHTEAGAQFQAPVPVQRRR